MAMDIEGQPLRAGSRQTSDFLIDASDLNGFTSNDVEENYDSIGLRSGKYIDEDNVGLLQTWRESGPALKYSSSAASIFCMMGALLLLAAFVCKPSRKEMHVRFFIMGDWGRQANSNQTGVAKLMGDVAAVRQPSFLISAGDNFYPNGLNSTDDPLFDLSFAHVYTAPSLRSLPVHAVLGNHDYGDGFEYCENDQSVPCQRSPLHQLDFRLAARDPRWHCERSYTEKFAGGQLEIFFIDTTPFQDDYFNRSWSHYDGGWAQQSWEAQIRELETRLVMSTARWKLVIGHHPPRSNGDHGNNTYIMQRLEPVLQSRGVHAYFSGHDHDLEHIHAEDRDLHIFVCGAGSDYTQFHTDVGSKYQHAGPGFAAVAVRQNSMEVNFYTVAKGKHEAAYTVVLPYQDVV